MDDTGKTFKYSTMPSQIAQDIWFDTIEGYSGILLTYLLMTLSFNLSIICHSVRRCQTHQQVIILTSLWRDLSSFLRLECAAFKTGIYSDIVMLESVGMYVIDAMYVEILPVGCQQWQLGDIHLFMPNEGLKIFLFQHSLSVY